MKVLTSSLIGIQLDWAVAKCEGLYITNVDDHTSAWDDASKSHFRKIHAELGKYVVLHGLGIPARIPSFSTDWAQGGPIIEREEVEMVLAKENGHHDFLKWMAVIKNCHFDFGDTVLVATMRVYVASKLGDYVDIPDDLM